MIIGGSLKIVYVLPYDWAGMPHYTAGLANAVSKYEEVIVIGSEKINTDYFNDNIKIIKAFKPISFSTNYVKILLDLKNIIGLLSYKNINIVNELNPDIIHFTTPILPPLPFFVFLYRLDKKFPVVYTKHSLLTDKRLKVRIFELITNISESFISYKKWISHTEYDKNQLIEKRKIKAENITIIPIGAFSLFRNYDNNITPEKNSILFFGRITQYKGIEYLLNIIPRLIEKIPDVKVTIAGEGDLSPYRDIIKNIDTKHLEINNCYIDDKKVSELFQRADLIVLPYSSMTGQSGVLSIACAYHKPIVATDVSGFYEIVENGENGFLIPPRDEDALVRAITDILDNDDLKMKMIKNMQKKAEELSWDNIAKKHIALYNECHKTMIK